MFDTGLMLSFVNSVIMNQRVILCNEISGFLRGFENRDLILMIFCQMHSWLALTSMEHVSSSAPPLIVRICLGEKQSLTQWGQLRG